MIGSVYQLTILSVSCRLTVHDTMLELFDGLMGDGVEGTAGNFCSTLNFCEEGLWAQKSTTLAWLGVRARGGGVRFLQAEESAVGYDWPFLIGTEWASCDSDKPNRPTGTYRYFLGFNFSAMDFQPHLLRPFKQATLNEPRLSRPVPRTPDMSRQGMHSTFMSWRPSPCVNRTSSFTAERDSLGRIAI